MFYGCSSLTSLDISGFNTEKVTDMSNMFYGLSSLEYLDIYNFNTKSCRNFKGIFEGCEKLTLKIDKEKCSNSLFENIPEYVTIDDSTELFE